MTTSRKWWAIWPAERTPRASQAASTGSMSNGAPPGGVFRTEAGQSGRQHEVDLEEVDSVVLALDLGRDENAEDVVAVRLERRARLAGRCEEHLSARGCRTAGLAS